MADSSPFTITIATCDACEQPKSITKVSIYPTAPRLLRRFKRRCSSLTSAFLRKRHSHPSYFRIALYGYIKSSGRNRMWRADVTRGKTVCVERGGVKVRPRLCVNFGSVPGWLLHHFYSVTIFFNKRTVRIWTVHSSQTYYNYAGCCFRHRILAYHGVCVIMNTNHSNQKFALIELGQRQVIVRISECVSGKLHLPSSRIGLIAVGLTHVS